MNAVRQRVPFRFSEDEEQDNHVLDEQEQEEVIDRLRRESASSNAIYLIGLQAIIGLSVLLHAIYTLKSPKYSPLAILFPDSPVGAPLPLGTPLALLQVLIHINLSLNVLPPTHPIRQAMRSSALPPSFRPPFPLPHPATLLAPTLAPIYALLLGQGWTDVLWWSLTGLLTTIVVVTTKWMRDEEEELANLEKLRYTARGA
ncbi:hypothetical protein BD413DRAFT_223949 [Trametes elegans]|nr:hypothetical protein BD413DRAFT_223949 [Trametes elegans]